MTAATLRRTGWIAAGSLSVVAALVLQAAVGTAAAPAPARPPGVQAKDCASCHEAPAKDFASGGHGLLLRSLGRDACDVCHGSPGDHARLETKDSITSFKSMDATSIAEACARCHSDAPDHLVNWKNTPWAAEGRSCLDCHSVHAPSTGSVRIAEENGRIGLKGCRLCHVDEAEAMLSSPHVDVVNNPHLESCETCHGPGGLHVRAVHIDPELVRKDFGMKVDRVGASCVECHQRAREAHAERRSAWERPELACTECHGAHRPGSGSHTGKDTAPFLARRDAEAAGARQVPDAACARCHDASIHSFRGSAHDTVFEEKGLGCQSCHGSASLHVLSGAPDAIVRPGAMTREQVTAFCGDCHAEAGPGHARNFEASLHGERGRTCLSCHGIHEPAAGIAPTAFASLRDARSTAKPVGAGQCARCHDAPHPEMNRSAHASLLASSEGCEGCHGPGGEHVASGGLKSAILVPSRLEDRARDGICLSCHASTTSDASWRRHDHGGAGLSCTDCHDPLKDGPAEDAIVQQEACTACHQDVSAQFRLPYGHRVHEGDIKCSDCHDLHRGATALREGRAFAEACAKCHRDQATPRLHQHVGDRHEGCASCHEAHGTTAPRLLRFRRVKELCLSCHTPPVSHDITAGGSHRNCVDCHIEVHGSDADKNLLR